MKLETRWSIGYLYIFGICSFLLGFVVYGLLLAIFNGWLSSIFDCFLFGGLTVFFSMAIIISSFKIWKMMI